MNVDAIWEAFRYVEQEPRRLYMEEGVITKRDTHWDRIDPQERPPCGTVCCLAGALFLSRGMQELRSTMWFTVEKFAINEMGLTGHQPEMLFYLSSSGRSRSWPPNFQYDLVAAKTPDERVEVLRRRIQFFINTKGTDDANSQGN